MKRKAILFLMAGIFAVTGCSFVSAQETEDQAEIIVEVDETIEEENIEEGLVVETESESEVEVALELEESESMEQESDIILVDDFCIEAARESLTEEAEVLLPEEQVEVEAVDAGNSYATATAMQVGTLYSGTATDQTEAYYKFTVSSPGAAKLQVGGFGDRYKFSEDIAFCMTDSHHIAIEDSEVLEPIGNLKNGTYTATYYLNKGTYYIRLSGKYSLKLISISAIEVSFPADHTEIEDAAKITLGKSYKGLICEGEASEFYAFTTDSTGKISVKVNGLKKDTTIEIADGQGNGISLSAYYDAETKDYLVDQDLVLTPEKTYYLLIFAYSGSKGPYTFSVKKQETVNPDMLNGFSKKDGTWKWYVNGKVATGQTGIVNGTIDGAKKWYFIKRGVYTKASGIAQKANSSSKNWFCVKDGIYDSTAKGIVKGKAGTGFNTWFYVENGIYQAKAKGIAQKAYGGSKTWFFVYAGIYDSDGQGMVKGKADGSSSTWFYVENGIYRSNATGVTEKEWKYSSSSNLFYIENGRYKTGVTAIAPLLGEEETVYYLVQNSICNRRYTGTFTYEGKTYTIEKGRVV